MKHLKTFEAFVNEDLVKKAADVSATEEIPADAGSEDDKKEEPEAEKELDSKDSDKTATEVADDTKEESDEKAEGKEGDAPEVEKSDADDAEEKED